MWLELHGLNYYRLNFVLSLTYVIESNLLLLYLRYRELIVKSRCLSPVPLQCPLEYLPSYLIFLLTIPVDSIQENISSLLITDMFTNVQCIHVQRGYREHWDASCIDWFAVHTVSLNVSISPTLSPLDHIVWGYSSINIERSKQVCVWHGAYVSPHLP